MNARKKEMMTWSLRIQNEDYRHDYEQYGNKITSLGLHEYDVDANGNIAVYRLGPTKDAEGSFVNWTNAVTYDRYAPGRALWKDFIEPDMKRWEHIEYYMQMIIFGPETVSRLLDSTTAQTTFINNLKAVCDLYRVDQNGNDLGYTGLEIDCEGSFSDDKWDLREGDDVKLINLLKRIKNEVIIDHHPDFKLRVNAHAMWGAGIPDYYRFHNYKLMAESTDKQGKALLDEVQIMTYDFSWSGSAPGPSTPLWWMMDVAEWVKQCFDPNVNPNAKCTIDNVYLGGAGYGRRWGIYSSDNWGTSVTYRNLVDWQNGYYIHHRGDGDMAQQDFIPMNAFNDPTSDNQIMYPHLYDYYKARHLERETTMGQVTARLSSYNDIEYATAYSKNQHVTVSGLKGVTGVSGVSEPTHNLAGFDNPRRGDQATVTLDGTQYVFQGYSTRRVPYVPKNIVEGGQIVDQVCAISDQPQTVLTFKLNVPTAGTYKVGAVVSFPFYGFTRLAGNINGNSFVIGDGIPDYYPMMFKGVHVWELGNRSLVAGENTIQITGVGSVHGTIIFGFFASDVLETELIGGYMNASPTIAPFLKRDKAQAKLPNELAFTSEVLQQSPRPVIMWEDFFRQYLNDPQVNPTGSTRTYAGNGLQSTTYYRYAGVKKDYGGGTTEEWTGDTLTGCYQEVDNGYSTGYWSVEEDENATAHARFRPTDSLNPNGMNSGQLVLNYTYNVMNISCEIQFKCESGQRAGIRFGTTGPGDGYLFVYDYPTNSVMLLREQGGGIIQTIASASLGDRVVNYGDRTVMKVMVSGNTARCTIRGLNLLGDQTITPIPGGMGFYAKGCDAFLYMLSIGTTEKWETLERFSIIVDGVETKLGELDRPGITRDQWGYLNYSGLNELNIRGPGESISLDYVFKPIYIPTFTGKKDVRIKLIDAGLWYKMLYIGDAEGMSITYAGDEQSFNRAMNIAVFDYNCKGIGLWVLGQADPRIFETLPDVVPWHE